MKTVGWSRCVILTTLAFVSSVSAGLAQLPSVTVSAGSAIYTQAEPIHAMVRNGLPTSIVAFDLKSYCTIAWLQRWNGSRWDWLGNCPLDRIPMPVWFYAGQRRIVEFPPSGVGVPVRPTGQYRIAVDYQTLRSDGTPDERMNTVYSPGFAVIAGVWPAPDKQAYNPGETIEATIYNGLETRVLVWDTQSYCSVFTLEFLRPEGWTAIAGCPLARPPIAFRINGLNTLTMRLPDMGYGSVARKSGKYRLRIDWFRLNATGEPVGAANRAYSPVFIVRDVPGRASDR